MRALRDRKGRREQGLFLAEGLRIAAEALDAGHTPTVLVITEGQGAHRLVERLAAAAAAAGGDVIATTPQIMARLVEKENPQAVLAAYRQWDTGLERLDRAAQLALAGGGGTEGPGQPRHHAAHLRRLRGGRADPARQRLRPVQRGGGAGVDGGAVHRAGRAGGRARRFWPGCAQGPGELVGTSLRAAEDFRVPRYGAPAFVFMGNEQSGLSPGL